MQDSKVFECIVHNDNKTVHKKEILVAERVLQLFVNNRVFSLMMQTPGQERYLVRGLLHSEGLKDFEFIKYRQIEKENSTTVRVKIDKNEIIDGNRHLMSTSSCGLCGKKNIENLFNSITPVERSYEINIKQIQNAYKSIAELQTLFNQTGGCHAASALGSNGQILCVFEDIGRHNAVDKVIGYLLETKQLNTAMMLSVSSRISFEIIQKCSRAGIPVLTAISAPSSLAVEMAKKAGITLAAFCRKDRVTLYSGFNGVIGNEKK
ncbi:MAG: FdhD protein [Francisellaceae bacterium]|jgi:FdhD protein